MEAKGFQKQTSTVDEISKEYFLGRDFLLSCKVLSILIISII
jgi:hypothetical protein